MKPIPLARRALTTALVLALPFAPAAAEPLELTLLRGGEISAPPVVSGSLVFMATGRVVAAWDYADPARPLRLPAAAPAGGAINALVRVGDHLYGSWYGYDGSSGVTTWSLADPRAPRRLRDDTGYGPGEYRRAVGMTVANGHLYLFDNEQGLLVSDLANPAAPVFEATGQDGLPAQFTDIRAYGNTLHASGRNWSGRTVYAIYDVSNPRAPVRVANEALDGIDTFRILSGPQQAIGIGNNLTVYNVAAAVTTRGSIAIPPATAGARVGDHVYSFGYGPGMGVWNVADPDAPAPVLQSKIDGFAGRHGTALGSSHMLLQTTTDLVHTLDVSRPGAPQQLATSWVPGGVLAVDAAIHEGRTVLLQANYGLTVNDSDTLAPLARVEASLPKSLEGRSFEQVALAGDIAWMAAWGYGLVAVDLDAQGGPKEVGRLEHPFAATLAIDGTRAYVGRWTNGGGLAVVDIANPAAPAVRAEIPLANQPFRMHASGGYLFVAQTAESGAERGGGLQVYDVSGRGAPVPVAHVDDGCGSSFDLSVDEAANRAYLACADGLRVIDIATPTAPKVIGQYLGGDGFSYTRVAQAGDRAWFADAAGVHELDVADPAHPELVALTPMGGNPPSRLLATEDQRLLALGGNTGVHVLGPDARLLRPREPATGLSGAQGEDYLFAVRVPAGVRNFTVLTAGGSGRLRLESRHQAVPEDGVADATGTGNLRVQKPAPGLHYIRATGTAAFDGVSLHVVF